jgi:hypothetical protein
MLAAETERCLRQYPHLTPATLRRIDELVRWLEPRRDRSVETDTAGVA